MQFRAIVVEDDDACRFYLSVLLEERGYEVLAFPDPMACPLYSDPSCACSSEDSCGDFLLTDNRMPRMTGLDFVEMQSRRGCKGVPERKAVFSATWSPEDRQRAEKLGCKVFEKPYDRAAIERWLDEKEGTVPAERRLIALSR